MTSSMHLYGSHRLWVTASAAMHDTIRSAWYSTAYSFSAKTVHLNYYRMSRTSHRVLLRLQEPWRACILQPMKILAYLRGRQPHVHGRENIPQACGLVGRRRRSPPTVIITHAVPRGATITGISKCFVVL